MAYKVFSNGNTLPASDLNTYLMNQSVIAFASTTARDAAIPSPNEGMLVWLEDSNKYVQYNGTAWVDLIDQATIAGYAPRGNAIINGAFDIWQRGTSFTTSGYTADRWYVDIVGSGGGVGSVSQQTFTPGTAPVAGYEGQYFLRKAQTTGSQYSALQQKIEDVRTLAGQTATLSFWAKGTNPTGNFEVNLLQIFGSGGSSVVGAGAQSLTISNSWTRYTYTFNIPSITGKTIGSNSSLYLTIYQAESNTSVSTLDIWGVQLEAGSVATPFKRNAPSIQAELAACQRYYWRWTAQDIYAQIGGANAASAIACIPVLRTPVTMRTAPTSVEFSTLGLHDNVNAVVAVTNLTMSRSNTDSPLLVASTASGLTQYRFYNLGANNSTSAYIGLSAEL